jgi:hypothetical protein
MPRIYRRFFCAAIALALLSGCGRKEPAVQLPTAFSFTATNIVVRAEEFIARPEVEVVKADFNRDGIEDMAVVENSKVREKRIVIYIQRKGEKAGLATERIKEYYEAGTIRRVITGPVVGLGTKKSGAHVDLLILYEDPDRGGSREMVHYRNDGKNFTEIY